MAKTKKNNLLIISLFGIFIFGIILYLILKPKSSNNSSQTGEIQPIIINSETLRPGVFPERLRPGVFPETLRPGVFPERLRPGVFPETLRPGVFPEKLRPVPQKVEGYYGSYVTDGNLTIKLNTEYIGEDYYCIIYLYDDISGELVQTYETNYVPYKSSDGYVYITLPKDSRNKEPLTKQKIKFDLNIISNSDSEIVFDLKKFQKSYATPEYIPDSIPIIKPETLRPGVFPETLRPGVFPEKLRPGVFPETLRPGVFPETLRPGVFPETLRPGVFPETLRPGVFPETLRPGVFPETLRPGVFPETLRPGVFPETLRPGVFPETLRPGVFPEILRPIPPVTTKKPLKICSGQLTLNSNKTDCCYKDETLLETCSRQSMTGVPVCRSRTDQPYDKSIKCCNRQSSQGNPLKYDIICKPKV